MDIFSITSDYSEYRFLTFRNDEFAAIANEFTGQSLSSDWKPIEVQIFEDKRCKEIRSLSFDASCYHRGQLWVKRWVADLLQSFFQEIEILPIVSDSIDEYYFVNILNAIPALKKPIPKYSDLMQKARTHTLDFDIDSIKDKLLFRDQLFKSGYYCTRSFVDFIKVHNIKGLSFVKEGVAK